MISCPHWQQAQHEGRDDERQRVNQEQSAHGANYFVRPVFGGGIRS